MRYHRILLFIFWILFLVMACNKKNELKSAIGKPGTLVIIKEINGPYWVIPGKGIEKFDNNQLWLKENTLITYGKGEGDINKIIENLIRMRETQRSSFQATSSESSEIINGKTVTTRVYDCFTGLPRKKISLAIEKIIEIKNGTFRMAD